VLAVVGLGEIFRDFGLSAAAVQAPALTDRQRATLFWLNTGIGAALTAIVFFGAPLVAKAFGYPELAGITHALAFTFLINGMTAQYRASLARQLRFSAITVSDIVSQAVGVVVAILAALSGAGYWSLVAQQLSQAVIGLIILLVVCRWLPLRPVGIRQVRPMINFGWNLAGSQLIGYLSSNIDTLIISLRFDAASLGLYNRAFQLVMRSLGQLRGPTNSIAVPVLARLQQDTPRSNDYVRRGQLALGYLFVPLLALAFAGAAPIVRILLGPAWSAAAPLIAALAAAGAFETLAYVGYWVYQARGLTHHLLRYSLLSLAIKISCVLTGSMFGLVGVAIGYAVAPALAWPLSVLWLSRLTDLDPKRLWAGAGRIIGCAVLAAGAGRLLADRLSAASAVVELLAAAAGVLGVYLMALLIPPIRRDVHSVLDIGRKALHR
jgi:PST family polysaccharide transporter